MIDIFNVYYDMAMAEFNGLVGELIGQVAVFSKDKSPYKINFGASISKDGRKSLNAIYYIHLEPGGNSMIAGGMYRPTNESLSKLRESFSKDAKAMKKILNNRSFKKDYPGLWDGDMLKTVPRGYAKDHRDGELLKYKSFIVSKKFTDSEVLSDKLIKKVVSGFKAVKPFNDHLNKALL